MLQARRIRNENSIFSLFIRLLKKILREIGFLTVAIIISWMLIALITFNSNDPAWTHTASNINIKNTCGIIGAWFADIMLYFCGYTAYFFPVALLLSAWYLFRRGAIWTINVEVIFWRLFGFSVLLIISSGMFETYFQPIPETLPRNNLAGGLLGLHVSQRLLYRITDLSPNYSLLIMYILLLSSIVLSTGFLCWIKLIDLIGKLVLIIIRYTKGLILYYQSIFSKKYIVLRDVNNTNISSNINLKQQNCYTQLPPIDLLIINNQCSTLELHSKSQLEITTHINKLFDHFSLNKESLSLQIGPVVTQFKININSGINGEQLDYIAISLKKNLDINNIRIIRNTCGYSTFVGLEIPNKDRTVIYLKNILETPFYLSRNYYLALALGVDVAGTPFIVDLTVMPHLLLAGSNYSDIIVIINNMIISLLYRLLPSEIKLVLIDNCTFDLSKYAGIPHLLTPVINRVEDVLDIIEWCTIEIENRKKIMKKLEVRNFTGINLKTMMHNNTDSNCIFMPAIVIIFSDISEFLLKDKNYEELFLNTMSKAYNSGIHFIIATSKISPEIISSSLKLNIPSRIVLKVNSDLDSNQIINQQGAECLLDQGDMLYISNFSNSGLPKRIHGAIINNNDINQITDFFNSGTINKNKLGLTQDHVIPKS